MTLHATEKRYVALYSRVSTKAQADQGESLHAQRLALEAWAEREYPGVHVEYYKDEGKSAYGDKARPDFERLRADIRSKRVLAVCATKDDRFSRNTVGFLTFAKECEEAKTDVWTIGGGRIESTAAGELSLTMLAAIAQFESKRKSERVKDVYAAFRTRGIHHRAPWGYRRNQLTRILEPGPDAHLVRETFRLADEGQSISDICRWLQTQPRENRDRVTLDYLSKLLRNPVYAGKAVYETRSLPQVVDADHAPLCPPDAFERIQKRLRDNTRRGHRGPKYRRQPLGPVARCGACGGALRFTHDGQGRGYISCNDQSSRHGGPQLPYQQFQLWAICHLETVGRWIDEALLSGSWRRLVADPELTASAAETINNLRAEREEVWQYRNVMPTGWAKNRLAEIQLHEDQLIRLLDETARAAPEVREDLQRLGDALKFNRVGRFPVRDWWRTAPVQQRVEDLARVVRRVEVLNDEWTWEFNIPTFGRLPMSAARVRQNPRLAALLHEMGFPPTREQHESAVKLRRPPTTRSAGRIRIPPCAASPVRG